MRRIQQFRAGFAQWWRKLSRSNIPQFAAVAVVAVILGITAGTYFNLPPVEKEPPAQAQLIEGEALKAVIRDQVHWVLQESYPWVLAEPSIPAVVEAPVPHAPSPAEARPEPEPEVVDTISFEHLIWPAKGEVSVPFGWYRHPVYNDWRFNAGIEIAVSGDAVRTVLQERSSRWCLTVFIRSSSLTMGRVAEHVPFCGRAHCGSRASGKAEPNHRAGCQRQGLLQPLSQWPAGKSHGVSTVIHKHNRLTLAYKCTKSC